jgi:hypothetical protein
MVKVSVAIGLGPNVAVTVTLALGVTVQIPMPEQPPPLQPENTEPLAAVALRAMFVPLEKLAEHLVPQLMPAGLLVTVPVPDFAAVSLTVCPVPVFLENVAVTVVSELSVMVHCPVPEHPPPLQPANTEPSPLAVRTTLVPLEKLVEHVLPQLIPAELLLTFPLPLPSLVTMRANVPAVCWVNVAVTSILALTVTLHVPVPEQPPPLQPENTEPLAATAVSVTLVPLVKLAEQALPQSMAAGLLVTVPLPAPEVITLSAKLPVGEIGTTPQDSLVNDELPAELYDRT